MSSSESLYDILGANKNMPSGEIKKSFLKLAKIHHPDKGGDTEVFKKMVHAYEVLCDEKLKSIYDTTGRDPSEQEVNASEAHTNFPFDIGNMFSMFGGGGMPFGMGGQMRSGGGPGFGFSANIPSQNRQPRPGKPPARTEQLNVDLEMLYNGKSMHIQLDRTKRCTHCSGSGSTKHNPCESCGGKGSVINIVQMGPMSLQSVGPCGACNGRGSVPADTCTKCAGECKTKEHLTCPAAIVPGMVSGDTITLSGVCSEMDEFEKCGDLILELRQSENSIWKRVGKNSEHLETVITLSLTESLRGCIIELGQHPGFTDSLFIKIPSVSFERDILVVAGIGMPIKNSSRRGDVRIRIIINVGKEERDQFRDVYCQSICCNEVFPEKFRLGSASMKNNEDTINRKIYDSVIE